MNDLQIVGLICFAIGVIMGSTWAVVKAVKEDA